MYLFILGVLFTVLFYFKLIRPCGYWSEKRVKHAKSWPGVGSMGKVFFKKQAYVDVGVNLYKQHQSERYVGYMQFMQQCLLLRDIELIKQVTIKDFNHFTDRANFGIAVDSDPVLSKTLISSSGEKWKNMRSTLSPAFTNNKMRNLYILMEDCAENFVNHFDEEIELEMRDTFLKVASNVIASTAFGIKIDCLKDPDNKFFKMALRLANFTFWQSIKLSMIQTFPKLVCFLQIELFSPSITKFFRSVIKDSIEKRENEEIVRPDMIHILLEEQKGRLKIDGKGDKNKGFTTTDEILVEPNNQKIELTDEHILAQAMMFFVAGFDTIATTCSFLAHELAVNPDIQKKLQEEIDESRRKHGNKFSYEAILGMRYLDQVVSETLRLWPVAFETDRLCVKDYFIQGHNEEKGFLVEKGIDVVIPIMAIQRDPQYFPEPNRFDPERFSYENKAKIIPGTYLPFGWGPKNCIGSQFALLEVKTLFCHLLSKFNIVPISKTEIPIKISRRHFNLQPTNGFWLGFKPREKKGVVDVSK